MMISTKIERLVRSLSRRHIGREATGDGADKSDDDVLAKPLPRPDITLLARSLAIKSDQRPDEDRPGIECD